MERRVTRPQLAVYAAAAIALALIGARYVRDSARGESSAAPVPAPALRVDRASGGAVVVDVAGAVRRPGVYRLEAGARVDDAVRRAGGATARADLASVNLAAKLEDGRQVLVPARARGEGERRGTRGRRRGRGAGQPVNLNTATLEQLDTLAGVGRHRAEDPRLPRAARRVLLRGRAGPGAGHRPRAPRGAARPGARMSPVLAVLRAHPRHLVLAALVAGLLAGQAGLALAGALAAVAAGLAGVLVGAARRGDGPRRGRARAGADAAIDASLRPLLGREVRVRATALDRPRTTASGARSVHVRLEGGPGRGERVRVRLRDGVRWPALAPGDPRDCARHPHAPRALRGVRAPPRGTRGAGAARRHADGRPPRRRRRRRRRRAHPRGGGPRRRPGPREAGLLRGMVLGEDEAIAERSATTSAPPASRTCSR